MIRDDLSEWTIALVSVERLIGKAGSEMTPEAMRPHVMAAIRTLNGIVTMLDDAQNPYADKSLRPGLNKPTEDDPANV